MEEATRYKIVDIPVDGEIAEIGELDNWGDGGKLRALVIRVAGLFGPALVPVTVFGDDAVYLDPGRDVGKQAKCTGRLTSRRYTDRAGKQRWFMSMTARGLVLSDAAGNRDPDGAKALADATDIADDIPF